MYIVLVLTACFTIVAAIIPLIRTDAWWVRSFDYPRAQLATLGLLVFIALLFQNRPYSTSTIVLAGALFMSLLLLLYRIFPYTRIAPRQVQPAGNHIEAESIRIICSNVLQSNRKAEKLLALINRNRPDLLLAMETDTWWEKSLRQIEVEYPHRVKQPLDNTYGMLLYSKFRLKNAEIKFIVEDEIPSIFSTVLLPSGRPIEIICVHPRPPRPDKMQDSTSRDAELLIVAKYVEKEDRPLIVMGDFNDVAWSHTTRLFQRISGLLDPRRGRGFFNTFHADYPFFRYPLDHVFHSHHFRVQEIKRLGHMGSDHFPIYAELSLEEDAGLSQEAPENDTIDEMEARKMIRKAFESDSRYN